MTARDQCAVKHAVRGGAHDSVMGIINYTLCCNIYFIITDDEADDCYGSVNIAENDLSRLAGVKLSAVTTLQTQR